jgi:hypothetical protein
LSTLKPMTGMMGSQASVSTFQRKPGTIGRYQMKKENMRPHRLHA